MEQESRNLTGRQIADRLGLSADAVTRFSRRGCPCDATGPPNPTYYNEAEVRRWLAAQHQRTAPPNKPGDAKTDDVKRDIERERYRKLKLENDALSSKLVSRAVVDAAWDANLERIRHEFHVAAFSGDLIVEVEASGGLEVVDMAKAKKTLAKIERKIHASFPKPDYAKAKRERLRKILNES